MTGIAFVSIVTTFIVTMMVVVIAKERAAFQQKREDELRESYYLAVKTRQLLERNDRVNNAPRSHKHSFKNKDVIEVKDLLEEEVLAWLCPVCHERVRPRYTIPRDPSTVKMICGWQDA